MWLIRIGQISIGLRTESRVRYRLFFNAVVHVVIRIDFLNRCGGPHPGNAGLRLRVFWMVIVISMVIGVVVSGGKVHVGSRGAALVVSRGKDDVVSRGKVDVVPRGMVLVVSRGEVHVVSIVVIVPVFRIPVFSVWHGLLQST